MPSRARSLDEYAGNAPPEPGPGRAWAPQLTTVWSFPDRGSWATHQGDYPGNWSPHVPRNLILRYTKPADLVLDPMCGSGTSLIECALLARRGIGVDVHPEVAALASERTMGMPEVAVREGDARSLPFVADASVDLVLLHPPYAGILRYGAAARAADLSQARGLDAFFAMLADVARESFRVTKPGAHCAVLMGDTRERRHFVPLSTRTLLTFLDAGFVLREEAVKLQHNVRSAREGWKGSDLGFLRIAHERLFVFRRPMDQADARNHRRSAAWWPRVSAETSQAQG